MDFPLFALCAFAALGGDRANALRPTVEKLKGNMTVAPRPHVALLQDASVEELARALPMEVLTQALMLALKQEGMLGDTQLLEAGVRDSPWNSSDLGFPPLDLPVDTSPLEDSVARRVAGVNDLQADVVDAIEKGHLDAPTMGILISSVLLMVAWALVHQLWRTLLYMSWNELVGAWLKPLVMIPFFTYVTVRLYQVAKGEEFDLFGVFVTRDNNVLRMLLLLSAGWWLVNFILEMVLFRTQEFGDHVKFSAKDVYNNLTETMFNVAIRFVVQCTLMMVLLLQAQTNIAMGHPDEASIWRLWFNFGFALSLQFFLWVRQQRTWQDLLRLRSTCCVEFTDNEGQKRIIRFPPGEFYIRVAMSILTNGIFNKFLILAYPLFIFTNFGKSQGQELVRQALSITLVLSLDNLAGAKTFVAHKTPKTDESEDDS